MNRKLLLLNLVLLVAVVCASWQLRNDWVAGRARAQALLHRQAKPQAPPAVIFSRPPDPVVAATYADIALKMLFSKDRNPTVVVEVKPAPVKPMPPLPLLYGVMNLPGGATAVMSDKAGGRHMGIRPGDKVGEFTLLAVSREDITLEWDGKQLVKRIDDLLDRAGPPAQAPAPDLMPRAAPPAASGPSSTRLDSKPADGKPEPGVDIGNKVHACQAGDTSPAGTQANGYRKVVTPTPFGSSCRWEPM